MAYDTRTESYCFGIYNLKEFNNADKNAGNMQRTIFF